MKKRDKRRAALGSGGPGDKRAALGSGGPGDKRAALGSGGPGDKRAALGSGGPGDKSAALGRGSPGGLQQGMLLEDLGARSVRRNPLIADLLHRIDFIEKAGTGIRRMREGAKALGYPAPAFSVDSFFSAVFWPIRGEDIVTPEAISRSGSRQVNEPVNEPANERQRWFLTQMHQHIQDKAADITQKWGVSLATAKRDIAHLRNLGLIEFSGAFKTGGYRLKQSKEVDS